MSHKLRYCINGSSDAKEMRHPQQVISLLGINYERSEPFPMADCWIFYGCNNLPDYLPPFIEITEISKDGYEMVDGIGVLKKSGVHLTQHAVSKIGKVSAMLSSSEWTCSAINLTIDGKTEILHLKSSSQSFKVMLPFIE
ncbi:hypothetical protein [Yersinia rochesterensis]|uniref:hypothetical protein n=1 Tax=Yersinia rochesterensis TaxID=1604335 RepID=UPI0011A53AB6|nr:hypothetical protein [Yersinia rochesterensis]